LRRLAALLLALGASAAGATEVTVIRPKSIVSQEWPYYILVDDQAKPLADIRSGERATVQVPAEARTLKIHCPRSLGSYEESRIDFDAKSPAYFLINVKPDCVAIQPLDAKTAATWANWTRPRPTARIIEYESPVVPPKVVLAVSAAGAPATALNTPAKDQVVAATASWVEAFNSRDAARISALYDAEAVLTDAAEAQPRVGSAAIADYYKNAVKRTTQRAALGERSIRLLGDTAIDSGTLTYFEMRDGNATTTPGRYSLTYQNRGGKWLIVDHHISTPR